MEKTELRYQAYLQILKEELIPAMGCTEPIAVAYAAAVARKTLGAVPERVCVGASGSMIKNVKSVIVPNTDNRKGLEAAAAAGIVAGRPEQKLEVIADVTPEETKAILAYLDQTEITVEHVDNGVTFDIIVTVWKGGHSAQVRIAVFHTNIVHMEKDGEVLLDLPVHGDEEENLTDRSLLDMEHIWDFANTVDIEDVKPILDPQIKYNMAIAEEGLRGDYGANIGSVLLDMEGDNVRVRAKAYAAAGSDARMNGCEQPVVINSGSGNQGHHHLGAGHCLCAGAEGRRRAALPGLDPLQPDHHPRKDPHRPPVGLLRGHQRGGGGPVQASLTSAAVGTKPSSTPSSMRWPWCPASSAMVPRRPAPLRSPRRWKPDCSAIICTSGASSSAAATASWPRESKTPLRNVGRLGKQGMKETNREIIDIMVGCK